MKNVNFGPVERMASKYAGAVAMYFVAKNMKKKYNIEVSSSGLLVQSAAGRCSRLHASMSNHVSNQGDDRAHLYHALDEWVEAVGDRQFMVSTPDLRPRTARGQAWKYYLHPVSLAVVSPACPMLPPGCKIAKAAEMACHDRGGTNRICQTSMSSGCYELCRYEHVRCGFFMGVAPPSPAPALH